MTKSRPAVPEPLRRRVLVEAGHRCAIPKCRHIDVDVAHIVPYEKCQEHKYENLIALCPNCHRLADKGKIDRKSLMIYKANLRFTHDKFTQIEIDLLFDAYKLKTNQVILWPEYLMILIRRVLEAGYIDRTIRKPMAKIGGLKLNADHLRITEKGREFVDSLGLRKL